MSFVLVDRSSFAGIQSEWAEECKSYGQTLDDFGQVMLDHTMNIIRDEHYGRPYSIYSVNIAGRTSAIVHINRARLPGTDGVTQRVLSVLLAPRYDFADITRGEMSGIAAEIIYGAIELCVSEGCSTHIKLHCGNIADREFFSGVATVLSRDAQLKDVAMRGNWLHISLRN